MSEWKEVILGEVITFKRGHDLSKAEMKNGTIPVAGSSGIVGFHDVSTTEKPAVLIGRSGSIGQVYWYDEFVWAHNTALNVEDFQGNNECFVFYWLHQFDFTRFNTGSAVPSLNRNHLHQIHCTVPPLAEQEAIAEVLSSLDDKIELLKRQNKTLEGMAEALFRQWFIEEAQDDWEEVEMRDVFEEIESGRRPKGGVGNFTKGIPSIGAESVKRIGTHDFGNEKFVPLEFFESMKKGVVKQGDILVYKDGGVPGEFKPHFTMVGFGFPHEKMCINEHVFRCKPKTASLRAYSFCYLNSTRCRSELEERGTGAAIPGLNSTQFSTCPIPLPNEEKLNLFEFLAGDWLDRILKNANEQKTLENLRDTLLPKLMSGDVRVRLD
jgi:type I restriction enzyme S subunit